MLPSLGEHGLVTRAISCDIVRLWPWNFMQGLLPKNLLEGTQTAHYATITELSRSFTGKRWPKRLVEAFHDFSHSLWQHRCDVVQHSLGSETVETRMKMKAHELLIFFADFRKSNDRSILNWITRLENYSVGIHASSDNIQPHDIRDFIPRDRG